MRYRNEKHKEFIRARACVACLDDTATEAAHVRFADARIAKPPSGHAKPADYYLVPLCSGHHRLFPDAQHEIGERKFWATAGDPITVLALALKLFACFIDRDAEGADETVAAFHGQFFAR